MANRKRMYVQSIEEKMMYKFRDEYRCSIKEAWQHLKTYQFHKEMQKLNSQIK